LPPLLEKIGFCSLLQTTLRQKAEPEKEPALAKGAGSFFGSQSSEKGVSAGFCCFQVDYTRPGEKPRLAGEFASLLQSIDFQGFAKRQKTRAKA
jgi:hypothetical protein